MIEPSAEIINFQKNFRQSQNINSEQSVLSSFTSSSLISSARWVIISNKLVAYWPFAVQNSYSNGINEKHLTFSIPSCLHFLSLIYIVCNVTYVIYYFLFRFSEERKFMPFFDLILMTIWDLLVVVCVTAHRLYGFVKLPKLRLYWEKILHIVEQCTSLFSERDTELVLKQVSRWTIKWFVIFAALGITDCLSVVYANTIDSPEDVFTVLLYVYLEAVICMHNSSSLLLIYFIKVMTHGFSSCKRKLDQMSVILPGIEATISGKTSQNSGNGDSPRMIAYPSVLEKVFKLIEELEGCVGTFNSLFAFSLFLEAVIGFWQVMFAMYFLHEKHIENVAFAINMLIPILIYPACLICLCVASSKMTVECQGMIQSLQKLPPSCVSNQERYKIQLLVSRLSSSSPSIQVAELFHIGEPLLGSALNTLATYFIVLVQMKQISK